MGCCGSAEEDQKEKDTKFGSGDNDLSNGPVTNRGCTDAWCLIVFAASWVGFVAVSALGITTGDIAKLYMPRDFSGAYCDVETNWNDGPNLKGFPKQSYMMNVSSAIDEIAKQLMCSSIISELMSPTGGSVLTSAEYIAYQGHCCLAPSLECEGSLNNGGDITSAGGLGVITQRMGQMTGDGSGLASPGGVNGDMFTEMWEEATKYFVTSCVAECTTSFKSMTTIAAADKREYTYEPSADWPLKTAWDKLKAKDGSTLDTATSGKLTAAKTQLDSFKFPALPKTLCPYDDPKWCVPFPGVEFEEIVEGSGYCTFKMAAEAAGAVGDAAASAMTAVGGGAFAEGANDGIGEMMGNVLATIDTIIVVAIAAFVIGLVFLVILRFTVGACVWLAVLLTCFMFPMAGAMAYVRAGQCMGAGFFETGTQVGVAVAVAGSTAVSNAASGTSRSEAMTGDGADYNGVQKYTRSGKTCKNWVDTEYNGLSFDNGAVLEANYCRNPYNAADPNKARTIWCKTTDPSMDWELCSPIGVIRPPCEKGYAVEGEQMREMMTYFSYILWALSIVWVLIIGCFISRIRLAIALNKAAAEFLAANPTVLVVPIVQSLVGIMWIVIWSFLAAFLLSQVPDGYTPKESYATYLEAYGIDGAGWLDSGTPGKCTDKWPTGGVYKSDSCETVDGVVKCWKCFPPRYVFDQYFAYSFFCFLWNNAFNIALGQACVAMCVATWFFTDKNQPYTVVGPSVKTIMRYHLGSIAFGSFIIALIQFIRAVMKYLEKQAQAQKNKVMVLVFKVIGCCIWIFEKCMQFLNKNAYIQIALMGTNFCTSAKKAFFLILRNALRFGTVAVLGQVVHYIGVFCVTIATVFIGYFLVRLMHDDIPPLAPMMVFSAIGYVVAELFMSVFGMATDTSLQCFIAVEEMGGHPNVPDILSKSLPEIADKGQEEDAV